MNNLVTNTWYAVERSTNLKRKPTTVERLGTRYVLWRTGTGVHAAPAQCPHRGADLGNGAVRNSCLTCLYHGIRFESDGRAVHRPAQGDEFRIPARANLRTVPAYEAHGYVWIWLGDAEPTTGPQWFDDGEPRLVIGADQIWDVHYSRFMESALDFHHVPFVHGRYTPGAGQRLTDVDLIDHYVQMAHLRAGSVAVQVGDQVRAGDIVGRCGNSGHSLEPHLHMQVQDTPDSNTHHSHGDGNSLAFRFDNITHIRDGNETTDQTSLFRRNDRVRTES